MRKYLALAVLFLVLPMAGCNSGKTEVNNNIQTSSQVTSPQTTTTTSQNTSSQPIQSNSKKVTVNLYFPDDHTLKLAKITTQITVTDGAIVHAIIDRLQQGIPGYGGVMSPKAKLLKASVKDGTAYLDFSHEFRDDFHVGSSQEDLSLYSIVNSLTELPNIKRVWFYLEGQPTDSILGHEDTSRPMVRNTYIIEKSH